MSLRLEGASKVVGADTHIHPTDLELSGGTMNVLLGPTLSGKTSLMRLMAGLDGPALAGCSGTGEDVTGSGCRTARSRWSTSSSSTIPR
jgi:glycerol transport system ATP-binding protein